MSVVDDELMEQGRREMSKKKKKAAKARAAVAKAVLEPKEMVNHPAHYGGDTPYEVIKVLEAWLTPEEYEGFLKGNIIKYNARARHKGGGEDYRKAQFYTNKLVDFYEKKDQSGDATK